MRQFNKIAFGVSLTLSIATIAGAGTRDLQKHGKFFQNVRAESVTKLLSGSSYVGHFDYNGNGTNGGYLSIDWYSNTHRYQCHGDPGANIPYRSFKDAYAGTVINNIKMQVRYPLVKLGADDKKASYVLVRYDSHNGWFSDYMYLNRKWHWAEVRSGHLQSELPAVTWELCPDFPSAESLGATVNHKQTAKRYFDLVAQDAGRRVLKPEYEAMESTAEWLNYRGQVQDAEKLNDQLEAEGKANRRSGSDR